MNDDPFKRMAVQIVAPRKARIRAIQTRAERKREKEERDKQILYRLWQKWHREKLDELLAGPHHEAANELSEFLQLMQLTDADALVAKIKAGPWPGADDDTKFTVLSLVSSAIIHLRERAGLEPMDDAIPWSDDEPTVFEIIKAMLQEGLNNEHRQGGA